MTACNSPSTSSAYAGQVDPRKTPSLLPFGLLYHTLMPHNTVFELDGLFPPRPGLPPWTMRLELAYHQFDPATWDILKADDDADLVEGAKLLKEWEAMQGSAERDSDEALAVERSLTTCWNRIARRWMQLYALHTCRQQYFEKQKQVHPGWTDRDVLADLPLGDDFAPPPAASRSLWPLPIPHPDPGRRSQLIHLCGTGFDWSPFCLWDESTTESELGEQRLKALARQQQEKLANAGSRRREVEADAADVGGIAGHDRLLAVHDSAVPLQQAPAYFSRRTRDKKE